MLTVTWSCQFEHLPKLRRVARNGEHALLLVTKLLHCHVKQPNEARVLEDLDLDQESLQCCFLPCPDEHWYVALCQPPVAGKLVLLLLLLPHYICYFNSSPELCLLARDKAPRGECLN